MKLGGKSKRLGLHKQHKILKRIKEHHRDLKKENKKKSKKTNLKTTVIPYKVAHREELLNHVNEITAKEKEIRLRMKAEALKAAKKKVKAKKEVSLTKADYIDKCILISNMILFILDARDPMGTRCIDLEDRLSKEKKHFIFILNKIDLISIENARNWIQYLSQFACVIPFKSSVEYASKSEKPTYTAKRDGSFGVDKVTDYLKMIYEEQFKNGSKESPMMKVGVLGLPNTGKSSFINTVKRKILCKVNQIPGLTDTLTEVTLDKYVTLIDSPSIEFNSDDEYKVLKYFMRPEQIKDPMSVAQRIYEKSSKNQLFTLYALSDFGTFDQLMDEISSRYCALLKGGALDKRGAAIKLIRDWTSGKIFHCEEPDKCISNDISPSKCSLLTLEDEGLLNKLTKSCVTDALQSMDH